MQMDRRKLLAGMGAVALAGCSSQGSGGNDDSGDSSGSSDENEQSGPVTEEFINDTATVDEDGWTYWDWEQEQNIEYTIDYLVRDGPEIDAFVTTEEEFQNFEAENRFQTLEGFTSAGVSGTLSGTLGPGSYYFVLDNSNAGQVEPPTNFDEDPADVEVESTRTY